MQSFSGFDLFGLGQFITALTEGEGQRIIPEDTRHQMEQAARQARRTCILCGFPATAAGLARLIADLQAPITEEQVTIGGRYCFQALTDEAGARLFLYMGESRRYYYESPSEGWNDVLEKFPSARLDIEEASKCYALARYTASVFHSMRILEPALNALAGEFAVSTDRANWHNILDQVVAAIEQKSKAQGAGWTDQQFYSEAAVDLRFFKDAWRNHVMHVRKTFDEERALGIYQRVRDLMRHLSTKLSEPPL